jgi:tRNA-specific 2-thiouridylase
MLGIRHYVLDEREVFRTAVIDRFVQEWDAGETPNPCVECNRSLKFDRLVTMARSLGAEALATGHYARLLLAADGQPALRRGVDSTKDQAYFLYPLAPAAAEYLRFPLGAMAKVDVRAHAARLGLGVADKAESMDICFVGSQTARAFVEQAAGARPGLLVDIAGTRLGQHEGVAGFTVGQRKGLGLLPRLADASPRFVVDKHADGTVVVGGLQDLGVHLLELQECTWVSGRSPQLGAEVLVQVRHHGQAVAARVAALGDGEGATLALEITGELRAAGRGQSGVLFDGDRVLGGGRIAKVTR